MVGAFDTDKKVIKILYIFYDYENPFQIVKVEK